MWRAPSALADTDGQTIDQIAETAVLDRSGSRMAVPEDMAADGLVACTSPPDDRRDDRHPPDGRRPQALRCRHAATVLEH